ncbi:hypothetical protein [Haliea sp. E17]|uniref:hypothetical protein n=1 Tax=Haliea sp. E17 TaxID=3401576 RepID=UPI003AB022E8
MKSLIETYVEVTNEFNSGIRNAKLWDDSLEFANGNFLNAKYHYIEKRVQSLSEQNENGTVGIRPIPQPLYRPESGNTTNAMADRDDAHREYNTDEDSLYCIAISEFESTRRQIDVWAQAQQLAPNSLRDAKRHYIRLRVNSLKMAVGVNIDSH